MQSSAYPHPAAAKGPAEGSPDLKQGRCTSYPLIQYHKAREADEGLRWLRGELKAEAAHPHP